MSKPDSYPVPEGQEKQGRQNRSRGQQEPLSGSKKIKQKNHVRHNNPEG